MSVIKIFPSKDASIYSYYPTMNAGTDEILDISLYQTIEGWFEVARTLIAFPQDEILTLLSSSLSGSRWDAYLKLYLAAASNIPLDYTLHVLPLSQSWSMGTGRVSNIPTTIDGVSWTNNTATTAWAITNFTGSATASFPSLSEGGGNWYSAYDSTASYTYITPKDMSVKTTSTVNAWISGTFDNNGFVIKHDPLLEFASGSVFELKYFSVDTHTVYPPCLEFRWDDSVYDTGSYSTIATSDMIISLQNNLGNYKEDSIYKFRLGTRPRFPTRIFTTASIYSNNYMLPSSSYWSIKDYKTEDTIINFDDNYTKISADGQSSYFKLHFNGLQPERYYRIVIKSIMSSGEILIFDNNYIFKVIR